MKRNRRILLGGVAGVLLVTAVVVTLQIRSALERKRDHDRVIEALVGFGPLLDYEFGEPTYPFWLDWVVGEDLASALFGVHHVRGCTLHLEYSQMSANPSDCDRGQPYQPGPALNPMLEYLATLHRLERLFLTDLHFPADGFSHLTHLIKLKELSLLGTNIDDADLQIIAGYSNLENLNLAETKVTDEGLRLLKKLTKLRHLDVRSTGISPDGLAELQKALPNCKITGP